MQVDHFIPQSRCDITIVDDISNLMPSFRRYIAEIPKKLKTNYIYKIGLIYGNVIENEKPIKFYFEEYEERRAKDANI